MSLVKVNPRNRLGDIMSEPCVEPNMFLDIDTASRHFLSRRFACLQTMLPGKPWLPIVSNPFGLVACCVSHCNSYRKKGTSSLGTPCLESFKKSRHYAHSAINTPSPSPKMARFPMTEIPGTLDSAKNDGHQAFHVHTSIWSVNI